MSGRLRLASLLGIYPSGSFIHRNLIVDRLRVLSAT